MVSGPALLLTLHGAWRWVVLLVGVVCVIRAARGCVGRTWTTADHWNALVFVGVLDTQLTLGFLLLFAVSAPTRVAFLPHVTVMLAVVALVHAGKIIASHTPLPVIRQRVLAFVFTPAVLLMIAAIPWGRPLLR